METALAVRLAAQGLPGTSVEAALAEHRRSGAPIEEALIAAGVPEVDLLTALGHLYDVQFLSSAKLARARVHAATLSLIPQPLARRWCAMPLHLDADGTLTVVAARPGAPGLTDEFLQSSRAHNVRVLVARPKAVRTAITTLYQPGGAAESSSTGVPDTRVDSHPRHAATERRPNIVPSEERLSEEYEVEVSTSTGAYRTRKKTLPSEMDFSSMIEEPAPQVEVVSSRAGRNGTAAGNGQAEPSSSLIPHTPPPSMSTLHVARSELPIRSNPNAMLEMRRPTTEPPPPGSGFDMPELGFFEAESSLQAGAQAPDASETAPTVRDDDLAMAPEFDLDFSALQNFSGVPQAPSGAPPSSQNRQSLEPEEPTTPTVLLLERLVPILETQQGRSGHSESTSKTLARIARELGAPVSLADCKVAALLHDLGKGPEHFTALSVALDPNHRDMAETQRTLPLAVASGLDLPKDALDAVASLYERFDGKGLPKGLAGEKVPLLARMLALAESYSDLVASDANVLGRQHAPGEALTSLRQQEGKVFDPEVIQALAFAIGHDTMG